jgi:hypothetical protein
MKAPMNRRAAFGAFASFGALAAVPAIARVPIPANASPDDPIFAAIERHRAAFALYADLCARTDEAAAEQEGREITQVQREAFATAGVDETESRDALIATAPTTIAGLRTAIDHLVKFDSGCLPDTSGYFLATLLKSPLLAA